MAILGAISKGQLLGDAISTPFEVPIGQTGDPFVLRALIDPLNLILNILELECRVDTAPTIEGPWSEYAGFGWKGLKTGGLPSLLSDLPEEGTIMRIVISTPVKFAVGAELSA
jgi:hypothetical protein